MFITTITIPVDSDKIGVQGWWDIHKPHLYLQIGTNDVSEPRFKKTFGIVCVYKKRCIKPVEDKIEKKNGINKFKKIKMI